MDESPQQQSLALSIQEACAAANVSRTYLYSAMQAGELPAKKCGRHVRILRADLEQWLRDLPPAFKSRPRSAAGVPPSLGICIAENRDRGSLAAPPTESPEAVARPRFPQNVACGFPAPTLFDSWFTAPQAPAAPDKEGAA
ncbi:helix-turn-helix domain-containing protein [Bradyrhizobium sp. USDA 3315]